jgi:hypothetical protein
MARSFAELAAWEITWLCWWVKDVIRDQWGAIPGPQWVKIIVMTLIVAALVFPGQADEIILIGTVRGISWLIRHRRSDHP